LHGEAPQGRTQLSIVLYFGSLAKNCREMQRHARTRASTISVAWGFTTIARRLDFGHNGGDPFRIYFLAPLTRLR
jgi:hypothetical protein